jgi:hypothetical protein
MVASSIIAMAQAGSFYAGGVVGFSTETSKPASGAGKTVDSDWAFGPEVGTFLQDDIQLGIALGIFGSTSKTDDNKTSSFTALSPTVYSRKFFKISDNFSTFAGLYLNYTSVNSKAYSATTTTESTAAGLGLRVGIGVAYALSPRFTAVGQYGLLGFQSLNYKTNGSETSKDTSFDFGVNTIGAPILSQGNGSGAAFNIGLYYTFMP